MEQLAVFRIPPEDITSRRRENPGSATLRHHDPVIGCLSTAGLSVALAAPAFSAIDSYLYGFAMQEPSLRIHTPVVTAAMAAFLLE